MRRAVGQTATAIGGGRFISLYGFLIAVACTLPAMAHAVPRGMRRPFRAPATTAERAANRDSVAHASCTGPRDVLTYHGGALVHSPDVFLLFWGPQWNSDAAHVAAKSSLISMFQTIGASSFACAWREYGVSGEPLGAGTYHGSYVIPTMPATPLSDAAIQSRIVSEVAAGHAPARTDDRVYMVVTPAGVPVAAGNETGCGGSNFTFCGYHDSFVSGGAFRYAVLPFPCEIPAQGTCFADPSNDVATAFQVVGSHELTELVTDPDASPGGWYSDRTGEENADICAGEQCVDTVTQGATTFSINPAWSNLAKGCITSVPCPPQPIGCTDPAPGACAPGRGTTTSCEVEFQVDPNLTLNTSTQLPTSNVTCSDGQTLCDFDTVPGQCTFHVAICVNNQDPRLACSPSSIDSITIKRPGLSDPIAVQLLAALQNVDGTSTGSVGGNTVSYTPAAASPDACTDYVDVVVPAAETRRIKLSAQLGNGRARSNLTLFCQP